MNEVTMRALKADAPPQAQMVLYPPDPWNVFGRYAECLPLRVRVHQAPEVDDPIVYHDGEEVSAGPWFTLQHLERLGANARVVLGDGCHRLQASHGQPA